MIRVVLHARVRVWLCALPNYTCLPTGWHRPPNTGLRSLTIDRHLPGGTESLLEAVAAAAPGLRSLTDYENLYDVDRLLEACPCLCDADLGLYAADERLKAELAARREAAGPGHD